MEIIQKEKESVDFVSYSGVVNINRFATDLEGVRDLNELKALEIFSHFGADEENDANIVLLGEMPLNGVTSFDFDIDHVNGTQSHFCGVRYQHPGELSGVSIGGDGVMNFNPPKDNWFTTPFTAKMLKIDVDSNIMLGDAAGDYNQDIISAYMNYGWQSEYNRVNSGTMASIRFRETGWYDPSDGVINSGPTPVGDGNIGDAGTMLGTSDVPDFVELGENIYYGGSFMLFYVLIPANAKTKNYKLRFTLTYE